MSKSADDIIAEYFDKINQRYLDMICKHIRQVGQLSATDLHRLQQISKMTNNNEHIARQIIQATHKSEKAIRKIMLDSGAELYEGLEFWYKQAGVNMRKFEDNELLYNTTDAIINLTCNAMRNLSNTTVQNLGYTDLIDDSILCVNEGVDSYNTVMSKNIRDFSKNGVLKVVYASGLRRRIDSAVRMNVLGGQRQLNNELRRLAGLQYGANGVEIDAHRMCAEDHINVQGKQFSLKEFDRLQNTLKRPISTCNCQHGISYIILGVNNPVYSKKELAEMRAYSNKLIDIDGKTVSRYQASQIMRQIETKMRYTKESIAINKNMGVSYVKETQKLKELRTQYNRVADSAGLRKRYDKARIYK